MTTQTTTIDRTSSTNASGTTRSTIDHTTNAGSTNAGSTTRSDGECRLRASQFLTELIGSPPDDLVWDGTHRLQGHGHLGGHELVVIAPRDDDHETVVVTPEDWDEIRRSNGSQRRQLLDAATIRDHSRLIAVLYRSTADLTFAA